MLEKCQSAKERWGGVSELIDRWLAERQQLIVLYCNISAATSSAKKPADTSSDVQRFCQILLDYTSAGHFEVYDQLVAEAKAFDDEESLTAMKQNYPRIEAITNICLAFNDRFDTAEHCEKLFSELPGEFSLLGEALEERFAIEDKLIEAMHNSHAEQVA